MSAAPRGTVFALATFATLVLAFLIASWLRQLDASLRFDWIVFQDSARLLRAGRLDEIYPGSTRGLPFLYPPPFLMWIAPLGHVGRAAGYALLVVAILAATAASLWLLARSLPAHAGFAAAVLLALSSAGWNKTLQLGQVSAFFLLAIVAGLRAWQTGREALAGALLALTMAKPSLGLVFPVLLVASRRKRAFAGWCVGLLTLIATSLPLGLQPWRGWYEVVRALPAFVDEIVPAWKQPTLLGFWRQVLPAGAGDTARAAWLACALPLAGFTLRAWVRGPFDPRSLARRFGIAVLALCACSPYLYLYDAWILVLPAFVWCFDRASWHSSACWHVAGCAIALVYLTQHATAWLQTGWGIAGPATALWLVADLADRQRAVSASPLSPREPPAARCRPSPGSSKKE